MKRRDFLLGAAAMGVGACRPQQEPPLPPTTWIADAAPRGHRLRDGVGVVAATETLRTKVLIAGAGIGGLSAAWWLDQRGVDDYLLLEMLGESGGNARAGRNAISEFPLAAHYLPLPTRESASLRELLAQLGAIESDPQGERPRYAEHLLCAAPQERLYIHGHWQDGLVPEAGLAAREREQIRRFHDRMQALAAPRGGRKPFALPSHLGAADADLLALDRLSMRDWMLAEGFDSPALHWYVDYACRDDYGTHAARTSAWAGIHYFASRDGLGERAAADEVLTAAGGNAWIARGLAARVSGRLRSGHTVLSATREREGWSVLVATAAGSMLRVVAQNVIWAGPLFVAALVLGGLPEAALGYARGLEYAPWVLAQLSLREMPQDRQGAPLSWDNVFYGSGALGYAVATHQNFRLRPAPSVWTWYCALDDLPAREARRRLLADEPGTWARRALQDMAQAHPDIAAHVQRIDCVRHGHAMCRPMPGFLTAAGRAWFAQGEADLQFAHADVSGFSLCEEAHDRGVRAAERIARRLRGPSPLADLLGGDVGRWGALP
ncbi:NAD(P)-binding protein [Niveibacterium sp. SC-1]|uniref:NAD(P)-binding protein n=1 Tax=Niveibacterium sp. SC-1 TaxID=3135646 RepID=UPI00311E982B